MGKKIALLIGVNDYDSRELANLNYAANDAETLKECLVRFCGFDEKNGDEIVVMSSRGGPRCAPHRDNIMDAFHRFCTLSRYRGPDLFFFSFSGHGFHQGEDDFLCARDSRIDFLPQTAITEAYVEGCLKQIWARNTVMLLDMCRNIPGRGGGAATCRETLDSLGRNIVLEESERRCLGLDYVPSGLIFNACGVGERANEWPDRGLGVFTACFCDALGEGGPLSEIIDLTVSKTSDAARGLPGFPSQMPYSKTWGGVVRLVDAPRAAAGGASEKPPEKENPAQKQEMYRLRECLRRLRERKRAFDEEKHDRGQTFGGRLDALGDNIKAGGRALENREFSTADACFRAAEREADWIAGNAPLRRRAGGLLSAVEEKRRAADAVGGRRLAEAAYRRAAELADRAGKDYEAGNFAAAAEALEEAAAGFEAAGKEARGAMVKELLEAAEQAREREEWGRLRECAGKIRPLDPAKADELTAYADGRIAAENALARARAAKQAGDWQAVLDAAAVALERDAANAEAAALKKTAERHLAFSTVLLPGDVKLEMVELQAGSFLMGSPEGEPGRCNDEELHRVTLTRDYWIAKYPVTQAQYEAVTGKNPSHFKKGGNYPVEGVSWGDARAFCEELNRLYAGELPKGYRFDLPTEAQWECACRAGTETALNSGKDLTWVKGRCPSLDGAGWYEENSDGRSHPVGLKRPNLWGLFDMHGNVSEWCRDWYRGGYWGDAVDPMGPILGFQRVLRGGGYNSSARDCRSAHRFCSRPFWHDRGIGFRIVCSAG